MVIVSFEHRAHIELCDWRGGGGAFWMCGGEKVSPISEAEKFVPNRVFVGLVHLSLSLVKADL